MTTKMEFSKDGVEQAFCFLHQKWRVFAASNMDWQKDDIEWAIGDYVHAMNPALYQHIAQGKPQFLLDHTTFATDMEQAVGRLELLLGQYN